MKDGNAVKITCIVRHETPKAVLIVSGGEEHWLPKSLLEIDKMDNGTADIILPEWRASKRGLM
jgi:hypothetical protein